MNEKNSYRCSDEEIIVRQTKLKEIINLLESDLNDYEKYIKLLNYIIHLVILIRHILLY